MDEPRSAAIERVMCWRADKLKSSKGEQLKSEFEEKQFEGLANAELNALPSGQVAEFLLGYDAVAHPEIHHDVWTYLASTPLRGVILIPKHWKLSDRGIPSPQTLPLSAASLILQYKRPERMQRKTAGNWGLWGAPYYRFKIDQGQHQVLDILETSLDGKALVRYSAPAFHTRKELEGHWLRRSVLANSGFVAPSGITGHRYWTYTSPGTDGQPNPESGPVAFETMDTLLGLVEGALTFEFSVAQHLADLRTGFTDAVATSAGPGSSIANYAPRAPQFDLDPAQAKILTDLKYVAEASVYLGLTWQVAVADTRNV